MERDSWHLVPVLNGLFVTFVLIVIETTGFKKTCCAVCDT